MTLDADMHERAERHFSEGCEPSCRVCGEPGEGLCRECEEAEEYEVAVARRLAGEASSLVACPCCAGRSLHLCGCCNGKGQLTSAEAEEHRRAA